MSPMPVMALRTSESDMLAEPDIRENIPIEIARRTRSDKMSHLCLIY